ncbi:MAG: phosphoglycolate phosphatase [Lentisphaeria bacterium]|nr:phosphoglycolate phosphatase [Lentisphaeria bacterium]MDP7741834.1 phosphoglycolate phosphatase [Lentisphaeria bacterium]
MDLSAVNSFLFDLDGTLVDTVPDLAANIDRTLLAMGRPPAGAGHVRQWIGNGLDRLLDRALTGDMDGTAGPDTVARARQLFQDYYGRFICEESRLYDGAPELLQALQSRHAKMAIVTNKPTALTVPLLELLGIRDCFETVVGGGDTASLKPDPAPLLAALQRLDRPAATALMVGDSINDIEAAQAAGIPCVAVSFGYNHGGDIRAANADLVIDSLHELTALLQGS